MITDFEIVQVVLRGSTSARKITLATSVMEYGYRYKYLVLVASNVGRREIGTFLLLQVQVHVLVLQIFVRKRLPTRRDVHGQKLGILKFSTPGRYLVYNLEF